MGELQLSMQDAEPASTKRTKAGSNDGVIALRLGRASGFYDSLYVPLHAKATAYGKSPGLFVRDMLVQVFTPPASSEAPACEAAPEPCEPPPAPPVQAELFAAARFSDPGSRVGLAAAPGLAPAARYLVQLLGQLKTLEPAVDRAALDVLAHLDGVEPARPSMDELIDGMVLLEDLDALEVGHRHLIHAIQLVERQHLEKCPITEDDVRRLCKLAKVSSKPTAGNMSRLNIAGIIEKVRAVKLPFASRAKLHELFKSAGSDAVELAEVGHIVAFVRAWAAELKNKKARALLSAVAAELDLRGPRTAAGAVAVIQARASKAQGAELLRVVSAIGRGEHRPSPPAAKGAEVQAPAAFRGVPLPLASLPGARRQSIISERCPDVEPGDPPGDHDWTYYEREDAAGPKESHLKALDPLARPGYDAGCANWDVCTCGAWQETPPWLTKPQEWALLQTLSHGKCKIDICGSGIAPPTYTKLVIMGLMTERDDGGPSRAFVYEKTDMRARKHTRQAIKTHAGMPVYLTLAGREAAKLLKAIKGEK